MPKKTFDEKIGDYYTSLATDKRFILLEDGTWDLRSRHTSDKVIKVVDSEEDEDEEDEELKDKDEELDEIEERLDQIHKLKRKYGNTIEEILSYLDKIKKELSKIENSDQELHKLEEKKSLLEKEADRLADLLSFRRRQAANEFSKKVKDELTYLDMPGVSIYVDIKN